MRLSPFHALLAAVIVVGGAAGFYVPDVLRKPVPAPAVPPATTAVAAQVDAAPAGYCCNKRGGTCDPDPQGPIHCLQGGGAVFHMKQDLCNRYCTLLHP